MIEIDSHNAAVEGLPKSLDTLYFEKSVDRICIFDCFAKNLVMDYRLIKGEWDYHDLPSDIVMVTRKEQKKDKETIKGLLEESEKILNNLEDSRIKTQMLEAYKRLSTI